MSAILQRHDFRANTMPVPPAWQAAAPRLMAASRSEFLTLGEHAAVVWLVVRGQAQVAAQGNQQAYTRLVADVSLR